MILEETINKLVRDSINLILATPGYTIKAKQSDAPRPIGDYASVSMISDTGLGIERHELTDRTIDVDIDELIEGMREVSMSINFFRDNAIDNARKAKIGFIRESIQDLFRSAKLGYVSSSEVREISEPLENSWEERAQFDIVLSAVGTDADIIRSIQTLDIAGAYQTRGLVYNFNIEVP